MSIASSPHPSPFAFPAVTQWLPDETFYSLGSRQHRISLHHLASTTCQHLFGHARLGSHHDFPSQISEFAIRFNGILGTADHIILNRTILPFYLPLLADQAREHAIAAMRGDGTGTLKFRLGLHASKFRPHHPLKACPACIVEDEERHETAYWHLSHQLPGVWICLKHQVYLWEAPLKTTHARRHEWYLPSMDLLRQVVPACVNARKEDRRLSLFTRLAHAAQAFASLAPGTFLDHARIRCTYMDRMGSLGWLTAKGRSRLKPASAYYVGQVEPLRSVYEFDGLPDNHAKAHGYLTQLMRPSRTRIHPLHHLTLIIGLFGTWDVFWSAYQQTASIEAQCSEAKPYVQSSQKASLQDSPLFRELVSLLQAGQASLSSAAKQLGVDVATAMAWAAKAGIAIKRRPKRLKDELRANLIKNLERGKDKKTVAQQLGLSLSTVDHTLRTEPGLHQKWQAVRLQSTKRRFRRQWTSAKTNNPNFGITALRSLCPAAYSWLRRNDSEWLKHQTASIKPARILKKSPVDWEARDRECASEVALAIEEIKRTSRNARRITLVQLYHHLPHLQPKLQLLDRLPLTRQVILAALGRALRTP